MKNKRIRMVTFTGVDDSVDPVDLAVFSLKHPRVEFGVLISGKRSGIERYPSKPWIYNLAKHKGPLRLAGHLCGSWSSGLLRGYDLLQGNDAFFVFDRLQLNFNVDEIQGLEVDKLALTIHRWPRFHFIIQLRGDNRRILKRLDSFRCEYDILYDESGGRGKVSDGFHTPIFCHAINVGYAGGINTSNVLERCDAFAKYTDRGHFNIDMESGVRENADGTGAFSLEKCEAVCQALEI